MDNLDNIQDAIGQVLSLEEQGKDLATTYDQLRLLGAVVGYIALLKAAAFGSKASDKISAAKVLVDLQESPQDIVERLRGAPFHDLTVRQLEHVVSALEEGRTDMSQVYEEARLLNE